MLRMAIFCAVALVPAASGLANVWHLTDSTTTNVQGVDFALLMYDGMDDGDDTGQGGLQLEDSESAVWVATHAATTDVSFGTSTWRALPHCEFAVLDPGSTLDIRLGQVSPGNVFTAAPGASRLMELDNGDCPSGGGFVYDLSLTPSSHFTVEEGNRLAIGMFCTCPGLGYAFIYLDPSNSQQSKSRLVTPDDDPGYPTPSMATILIVGFGSLMVTGAAYVNRRR